MQRYRKLSTVSGVRATTMLIALITVATLSGCYLNAGKRLAVARQSVTVTEEALIHSYELGVIDEDDILTVDPYIRLARSYLEEAKEELNKQHYADMRVPEAFDQYLLKVEQLLTKVRDALPQLQEPAPE